MADPQVYVTPVSAGLSPIDLLKFASVTAVSDTTETTILSYTCLGSETIGDFIVSGTEYARFNIYINTVLRFVVRSGPNRQANLHFQRPLQFTIGDVIDIKVIHYLSGISADFEATLLGV